MFIEGSRKSSGWHCAKDFSDNLVRFHSSTKELLSSPCYRWVNRGLKRLRNLLARVTRLCPTPAWLFWNQGPLVPCFVANILR